MPYRRTDVSLGCQPLTLAVQLGTIPDETTIPWAHLRGAEALEDTHGSRAWIDVGRLQARRVANGNDAAAAAAHRERYQQIRGTLRRTNYDA